MITLSGPPTDDSIVEIDPQDKQRDKPFYLAKSWIRWFLDVLLPALQNAPQVKATKDYPSTTSGSIVATSIGVLTAGTYRVSYYLRVTSPDGVSSSVAVTIGWTESGQTLSVPGPALTGDALTSVQSGTGLVILDPSSPITVSVTYASNTPNKMKYRLRLIAEQVG